MNNKLSGNKFSAAEITGELSQTSEIQGTIEQTGNLLGEMSMGTPAPITTEKIILAVQSYFEQNPIEIVSDYPKLENKPQINGVELLGNKTSNDLNLQPKGNYLTEIPKEYVKEEELRSYALKEELPEVPKKISAFENDKGYLTQHQDLSAYAKKDEVPVISEWALQQQKPSYTALEVGADTFGSASQALTDAKVHSNQQVTEHNTSIEAHGDIRILIKSLTDRLNALADSDDTTLDQMSEVVAYIKSNKSLIDAVTTQKVSYADIIDNLTTNVPDKPLSAAQGVVLKSLFDSIPAWSKEATKPSYNANEIGADVAGTAEEKVMQHNTSNTAHADIRKLISDIKIPTNVSEFQNDAGYLTQHQDISGKLDASKLPEAINTALEQAKNSGEFDGEDGITPVKGTDYFTANDKAQLVSEIAKSIPSGGTNAVTLNTAQTISAVKTFVGSNLFDGEQKLTFEQYCPKVTDIANGIGASMKNARAVDCQLYVAEIYAPYCGPNSTGANEEVSGLTAKNGVIDFYMITGATSGQPTGRKLLMQLKEDGLYVLGKKVVTQ